MEWLKICVCPPPPSLEKIIPTPLLTVFLKIFKMSVFDLFICQPYTNYSLNKLKIKKELSNFIDHKLLDG